MNSGTTFVVAQSFGAMPFSHEITMRTDGKKEVLCRAPSEAHAALVMDGLKLLQQKLEAAERGQMTVDPWKHSAAHHAKAQRIVNEVLAKLVQPAQV